MALNLSEDRQLTEREVSTRARVKSFAGKFSSLAHLNLEAHDVFVLRVGVETPESANRRFVRTCESYVPHIPARPFTEPVQ